MDKSELKRAIARSTNTGFNHTAYSELAASQEELNSQICKEAQQERSRRELFIGAPNNWEMAIKTFVQGRKNYLENSFKIRAPIPAIIFIASLPRLAGVGDYLENI